jgi:heme exporter protein C
MGTVAKYLLGLLVAATVVLAYRWLPAAEGFAVPEAARIVALHLPLAFIAMIGAIVAAVQGVRYLKTRDLQNDAASKNAAALAALFCLLTTVTGSVFARVQWGGYWSWDPKQTCIFILLLIYAAYFVLRAGVDDPEKRASVAAVYIVFAGIMTPMLGYVVPKYLAKFSLHPTNTQFDPRYWTVILLASLGFAGLYAWMQNLANRAEAVRLALDAMEESAPVPAAVIVRAAAHSDKETPAWTR